MKNTINHKEFFTIERLEDGFDCMRLHSVSRQAIDAWFAWISEIVRNWDPVIPYRVLYDLTDNAVSYTGYMRVQALKVNEMRPEVKGRIAIYMRRDANATIVSLVGRVRSKSPRPFRVFYNKDEALAWLRELKPPSNAAPQQPDQHAKGDDTR